MTIVLLDSNTLGGDISLDAFSKIGTFLHYPSTKESEVCERIKNADVIITNKVKLGKEALSGAKHVKLICVTATGYDNIDISYCKESGIAVCNVKGYSTECVTQITLSMALSLINHLPEFDEYVKSGKYTESGVQNRLTPTFNEICTKTWGIVGLGNIGKRVAQVATSLGCKVLAYKRVPTSEYECTSLEALMAQSDIISVHLPSSSETVGIINEKMLSLMKERAILINVARGNVVDESAVAKAVLGGKLYGFGCDVYSTEPFPSDHPYSSLSHCKNVILTPHMAWGAYETRLRLVEEVAKNVSAFFAGERRNRVV